MKYQNKLKDENIIILSGNISISFLVILNMLLILHMYYIQNLIMKQQRVVHLNFPIIVFYNQKKYKLEY